MTDKQDDPFDAIARRVRYSGRVQGVGFRATAVRIARSHRVTGWVRNMRDGCVELWVEGTEGEIESFLQAIRNHWGRYIRDVQIESQTGPIPPPEDCFQFGYPEFSG